MQITVQSLLKEHNTSLQEFLPKFVPEFTHKIIYYLLNRIIKSDEINEFIGEHYDKYDADFIEELFDSLNFSYFLSSLDKLKIPSEGKLIITANHPLGALDGLALLKAVYDVRKDVVVIANDLLLHIENLKDLFLPYNVFSLKAQKENIHRIDKALSENKAVIFFPSAVVSRLSINGIKDGKWHKGAVKFAKKHNAPILPVLIDARNSTFFYLVSILNKSFSKFLLPRELFRMRNSSIKIKIGNLIPTKSLESISDVNTCSKLLRKHTYKIAAKKEIFQTERTIIHPVDYKIIKNELANSILLGTTADEKMIYCISYPEGKNTIKEIARLREITFRKVGEGTGNKFDFDKYDKYYKHIVLWSKNDEEIIGSYRLGLCKEIIEEVGYEGLYNSEEFTFTNEFNEILPQSIELGRSFIQEKYWGSNALDSLWQGIGLYIQSLGDVKYLYGAVSISDIYPKEAKDLIVYYFKKWFSNKEKTYIQANNPYQIDEESLPMLDAKFNGIDSNEDFRTLKASLKELGSAILVLFRRYTELSEPGGAVFLDYNVDVNFSNCIDGFMLLDTHQLKKAYKLRYKFIDNALSNTISVNEDGEIAGQVSEAKAVEDSTNKQ